MIQKYRFRIHVIRQLQVTLAAVIMLFSFQNCGPGFVSKLGTEALDSSSSDLLFQQKALQVLGTNCKACHVDQSLGGVSDILNVNHLIDSGLIIVGDPSQSPLMQAVDTNSMPPASALSAADKLSLKNWILSLGGLGPDERPLDLKFAFSIDTDPLDFRTRLAKVSRVPSSINSATLDGLKQNSLTLGDYDFANGVIPRYSWETTDMVTWLKQVSPVCASSDAKVNYPWPSGIASFLMTSVGRITNSADTDVINQIESLSAPSEEKFEVFCLTVLTSLEFVGK